MEACELLDKCGFFKKYSVGNQLACRGFVNRYCKGELKNQCKRMEYRITHGTPPPDNMLPTGVMMK